MSPDVHVSRKKVADTLVASMRFRGQRGDVDAYLTRLREQVEPYINGKPIILYYYSWSPEEDYDIEVCYPVFQAVEGSGITNKVLEGGWMICTTHVGPYGPPEAEGSLSKTWAKLGTYIREHRIALSSLPLREVRLEGAPEHGDHERLYVTELQTPQMLGIWLDRLAGALEHFAGTQAKEEVMKGSQLLMANPGPQERVEWILAAMDRLDAVVPDEETRQAIMMCCTHRFPQSRIDNLRAEYERLGGDIDALLQLMLTDRNWRGAAFVRDKSAEDIVIRVVKVPQNAEAYRAAQDETEKRYHYCHCTMVKEAIRTQAKISPTFCQCGSGWYEQLWGGITGKPVRIGLERSVLQGDRFCRFSIHIPKE